MQPDDWRAIAAQLEGWTMVRVQGQQHGADGYLRLELAKVHEERNVVERRTVILAFNDLGMEPSTAAEWERVTGGKAAGASKEPC